MDHGQDPPLAPRSDNELPPLERALKTPIPVRPEDYEVAGTAIENSPRYRVALAAHFLFGYEMPADLINP